MQQVVTKIYKNENLNENYLNMKERFALTLAAKYISDLNDTEFIDLLQNTNIVTESKAKSLTRKYKDIVDLKSENYIHLVWKVARDEQKEATSEHMDKK